MSLELDLEEAFGVPNCFSGVLITGSRCLLDSGVVDPRDVCNFNSSTGCQDELEDLSKLAEEVHVFSL